MIGNPAPFGDLFHVGLRVADVEASMADLSASMGLDWAPPLHIPMRPWVPGQGYRDFEIAMTESVAGPIHIELTHGPVGSIWDAALGAGLHHFGVWVDDVAATVSTQLAAGWALEMAGASPEEGYGAFAYLRSPSGVIVEPVSATSRAWHQRWWDGDELGAPGR
ncbi:VOC family protein [Nocardioides sp. cx-173]|uniref:VOC family protein n=1 Tax=Nocardioides sp. cx-173 TaxID=2898796 RepID=UPI001E45ECB5|nr:VOC family protein [Nocardioides sp. cx-173]MCD4524220.1 VOC family protein [Nocardioides sp. cx-173]UGB41612.1 VOC family protein [Nocardioides sp. cx-173]